jgi:acylphosphatase
VFYRVRVREAAKRYGVAGSVENFPDGTVSIDVQGPFEMVEKFVHEVSGPRGLSDARSVRRVAELPISPDMHTFEIRRD